MGKSGAEFQRKNYVDDGAYEVGCCYEVMQVHKFVGKRRVDGHALVGNLNTQAEAVVCLCSSVGKSIDACLVKMNGRGLPCGEGCGYREDLATWCRE